MVLVWENERNDFMNGWAIDSQMHTVSSLEFMRLQDRLVSTNHPSLSNVPRNQSFFTGIFLRKSFSSRNYD